MRNDKEFDITVYEPVKRSETEAEAKTKEEVKVCKKYSGLYNRGNTCYLNSLLQTLFMTPEFRKHILSWKFDENIHDRREDCIPFQLQKLFARMQLKFRDSEMTEDLTKSFQWGYHQLLEQHDIQELCRVLFEAIDSSLYEHENNFLNQLYQGNSTSVVKCLECKSESVNKDNFMDISLPVRNEFDKIYNSSLEMAFSNFLKTERLEKDNQYLCGVCNKKVDALKYVKFTKLPKILFLQLNRFEYDIMTDGRKKIGDRLTFPQILNMNLFLKDYEQIKEEMTAEHLKQLEVRGSDDNFDETFEYEEYTKQGDYVYELFAVVVHSGSARGGHYYSYIKSFEDGKWYRFDDCCVYESDFKHIQYTYGESGMSALTGYILMYRLIERSNPENNTIDDSLIAENKELMEIIEKENVFLKEEEERQKEKLNSLQLKFVYDDKIANILAKKTDTVGDLKQKVLKEYLLDIAMKNCRIRFYNSQSFKMLQPLVEEFRTLEESAVVSHKTYALEVKKDDEEFEDYNPNSISVNVCLWDQSYVNKEEKDFRFEKIKIDKTLTMSDFRTKILDLYKIDLDKEIFVIKKVDFALNNYQVNELLNNEEERNKQIHQCLSDNSKVYLEVKDEDWKESRFIKHFDENSANIVVKFNFPIKKEEQTNNTNISLNGSTAKSTRFKKPPKITMCSYKFDNQIEIKKYKTLGELKKRIAEMLNINENEFIIKKNSHNGVELKNLTENIDKHTSNVLTIYTEFGNPQKSSEIKINLYKTDYDFSFFLVFPYKTTDEGVFLVDLNWTIGDLKKFLVGELGKKVNSSGGKLFKDDEEVKFEEIFIRDYKNDRPSKIYRDTSVLGKDLQFTEKKKIIIQRYRESKIDFREGEIQLSVRAWDPSQWKISAPIEIHFSKGLTFLEFAHKVHELFPQMEPQNISAFKILNEMNVYMDDFKKYKVQLNIIILLILNTLLV